MQSYLPVLLWLGVLAWEWRRLRFALQGSGALGGGLGPLRLTRWDLKASDAAEGGAARRFVWVTALAALAGYACAGAALWSVALALPALALLLPVSGALGLLACWKERSRAAARALASAFATLWFPAVLGTGGILAHEVVLERLNRPPVHGGCFGGYAHRAVPQPYFGRGS